MESVGRVLKLMLFGDILLVAFRGSTRLSALINSTVVCFILKTYPVHRSMWFATLV